tara:strand:- start:1942 stop:3204 length:1263 start_codon:yes stop_codon:yes gene_type:complete
MRAVLVVVLFSLITGILPRNVVQAHAIKAEDYQFPFQDPWIASICSAAVMFNGGNQEKIQIEMLPERRTVKLLENRNRVSFNLFEQKGKSAPLVFVLSGTGGTAFSSSALATGKQLFDLGYHVVTLPNNVNYQYAIGVSRTGAPGYMPNDAKEYYELLKQVTAYLKQYRSLQIQDYSIVGYSLGGLMAGFLVQEDTNGAQLFNFKKIVMIDPAVDIGYALDVLDKAYDAGTRISSTRKESINGMIYAVGFDVLDHGFNLNKILAAVDKVNLTMDERQWLVGYNFRNDLGDVVFASQQINDMNVLKNKATKYDMNARLNESKTISFNQYMREIVFPSLKMEGVSLATLVHNSNFFSLESLRNHPNLYIFANADDYIHRPKDVQFMKDFIPDSQFYLYPHGGHVGNLWYPKNRADLDAVMKF